MSANSIVLKNALAAVGDCVALARCYEAAFAAMSWTFQESQ